MSKITLDDPDTKKAVELYRSGATIKAAAEAIYMSVGGLKYRCFKKLGIPLRSSQLSPELVEKIRQGRRGGKTYRQLGQEYGVSYESTRKYAIDIDPGRETRGRKSTITLDDPINRKAMEIYKSGASLKNTAAAVSMSEAGLRHRFKVLGIPVRSKSRQTPPEIVEAMRREYIPNKNGYTKLAEKYGVSTVTVRKYVKGRK